MTTKKYTLEIEFESDDSIELFDVNDWIDAGAPSVIILGDGENVLLIDSFTVEEIV